MSRGPASEPPPSHFRFDELAPGVTFAEASRTGTALANGGIVDLGASVLVFDTALTLRAAGELRRWATVLAKGRTLLAANSHWHLDHVLGNQLFSARPIYATRRTAEILREKHAELSKGLTREGLEADAREMQTPSSAVPAAPSPAERAEYALALRVNRALWEEAVDLRLTPPSRPFEDTLELPGDRGARLLSFGGGHTESDALLWLPRDRILFAGDLVVTGSHPNLLSGDPERWLGILSEIERLRPERIGPGHGPTATLEAVEEVRDYLTTLQRLAEEPGTPEVPSRFRDWEGPSQFSQNLAFLRGRTSPAPR